MTISTSQSDRVTSGTVRVSLGDAIVMGLSSSGPSQTLAVSLAALVAVCGYGGVLPVLVCFVPMLGIALAYQRLNRWDQSAGATYTWVARVFNPYLGFLSGWMILLYYTLGTTTLTIPAGIYTLELAAPSWVDNHLAIFAAGAMWNVLITALAIFGLKMVARFEWIIVVFEYVVLSLVAAVGLAALAHGNLAARFSWSWFSWSSMGGMKGVMGGILIAYFMYSGWDAAIYVNEETADRADNPGRAALASVVMLAVVYAITIIAFQAVLSPEDLQAHAGNALSAVGGRLLNRPWDSVMALAVLTGTVASLQAAVVSAARMGFAMSRDRVMPRFFAKVRSGTANPWAATLTMSGINITLLGLALGTTSIAAALTNAASSLGLISIVFYGLTAAAALWQQRATLASSAGHFFLGGLLPLIGLSFSVWVLVESLWTGAVTPAVMCYGLGSIALGIAVSVYLHRFRAVPFFISMHTARPDLDSLRTKNIMKYQNSDRSARSATLFARACETIPAGVNSTARARWSGWDPYPLFVDRGEGAYLYDVDGNAYIDYLLGLGPMILGHRPPKVTAAVVEQIQNRGTVFALPTAAEAVLAEKIIAAVPSIEQVRLCNTGTEAVIYALRLARAFTGRSKVIRFEGMYHGFSDAVYWSKHPALDEAGPDHSPIAVPQGPGISRAAGEQLIILPWNDIHALREVVAREGDSIAAILTEPVMCNTGCILPEPGYLAAMREIADSRGIVLIYDEVITGFRLGFGGAQGIFGIKPDLTVFAKGLGGGFPVAALGGRRDIMKWVADGIVSMAGTYSANGIAVAAANAALDELGEPGKYEALFARCSRFYDGLSAIFSRHGLPAYVVGLGPVLQVWFAEKPIRNYRDAARFARHDVFRVWWEGMLERNVLFHPGAFENLFVSFAHSDADIERTLVAADEVAGLLRPHV